MLIHDSIIAHIILDMTILEKFRLDGKVAVVTGGNRGIGLAIATGLAEAGADVVNISRGEVAPELQAIVEGLGQRFLHVRRDMGDVDSAESQTIIDHVTNQMGRVDILVNNAGIGRRHTAFNYPEADWQQTMQVNLNAVFYLSQAAAKQMRTLGGGKIINIASVLSFQGGMTIAAYAAAKHGVAGMTKALANEWAPHNINVNAIAPGYFRTDLTEALEKDKVRNAAILERVPVDRWGDPAELQGIALLMASEAGRYMHGSVVSVDGGWMAR